MSSPIIVRATSQFTRKPSTPGKKKPPAVAWVELEGQTVGLKYWGVDHIPQFDLNSMYLVQYKKLDEWNGTTYYLIDSPATDFIKKVDGRSENKQSFDKTIKENNLVSHVNSETFKIDLAQKFTEIFKYVFDNAKWSYQRISVGGTVYTPPYLVYRASSIDSCQRQILLSKWARFELSEEDKEKVEELERFNTIDQSRLGGVRVGSAFHHAMEQGFRSLKDDQLQELKEKFNFELLGMEDKIEIEKRYFAITGHYDMHCKIDGKEYVVDFKTGYMDLDKYSKQLMIYQKALGEISGIIIHFDRYDFTVSIPVLQEYNEETFDSVKYFFAELSSFERSRHLPTLEQLGNVFHEKPCQWSSKTVCTYRNFCYKEDKK